MDFAKELGVQSFCFRGFEKNEVVAEKVKECGMTKIEICQKHVNFKDESQFEPALAAYRKAGVGIVSIGVQGFGNDEANERKFFKFAKAAGARFMSANFNVNKVPEAYRTAEKLAEEFDFHLGIHNHGGKHWLGSVEMLKNVFANTNKRIGLCLDTAWALDAREDPIKMAEMFADRLYGVHVKDFVFDRARKPEDVVVGTGNLDLKALLATLKKNGFNGYFVLEYEGDVNNPLPAIKKCVEAVRSAAAGL